MARSILANDRPIRRSQIREYRKRGAKIRGGHHGHPLGPQGLGGRIRRNG